MQEQEKFSHNFSYFSCLRSDAPAPYRSKSVVNLHHQDTETDEATMVLPPADYSSNPNRPSVKTNPSSTSSAATNNHHHSPTPSAASSSDLNAVSQWATGLVLGHSVDVFAVV